MPSFASPIAAATEPSLQPAAPDPSPEVGPFVPPAAFTLAQACNAAPDPMAAFGHYGETQALPPDAQHQLLAKPIDDMSPDEFQTMLGQKGVDPAQMQTMLDATTNDPARKLELWKKLHTERNAAELEARLPESDVGEDPERQAERSRREATLKTTNDELALETDALPKDYTMKDVDALISRKEKESDLEQKYGINITAQTELKANGERVMWSEDELDRIKTSLDQIPPDMLADGRFKFTQLDRRETVLYGKDSVNAYTTNDGVIEISDMGGAHGADEPRELKTPEFEVEHGTQSDHLERVFLHEMGHALNYGDPETLEAHEREWKTLPGHPDPSGEYFAEDFHHALNAPETLYQDAYVERPETQSKAQAAYDKDPSPGNKAALDEANAKAAAYPKMFDAMRNNVFHTDVREQAIAQELAERGLTAEEIDDFRAQAKHAATPDQLDRLAIERGYLF